ncbi:hypothetical protein P691DRAFT_803697 [Macrolepiota fuliginosa MF-IS2]|uniref:Uncharacterized protein n=1 Tax=Macrolepiota fuliginosa MF-IS2 TaxID=1400762 RepID=A0A9P5X8P4_9AGAR|nr:hypothetical protein P691DRAFT_803697 [Macrolepiota fuliginosa MF-IS2]
MQPQLEKMFPGAAAENEGFCGQIYADLVAHLAQNRGVTQGAHARSFSYASDDEQDFGLRWDKSGPEPRPPSSSLLSLSPQVSVAAAAAPTRTSSGGGSMTTRAKAARLGRGAPPTTPSRPVRASRSLRPGPRVGVGSSERVKREGGRLAHLVDGLEGTREEIRALIDGRRRELGTWERMEEILTLVLEDYGQ